MRDEERFQLTIGGNQEIDEGDQAILDSYMPQGQLEIGESLGDLIMRKIAAQEEGKDQPIGEHFFSAISAILTLALSQRDRVLLLASIRRFSRSTPSSSLLAPAVELVADFVFRRVGNLLSRYKSGPLPKAFKILPTLSMWPTLLMLTTPENWTPHATYAATKIFASNLDPKQSQKFYKEILLSKVREEIASESNKLSVQTYMALKKSIYKPAAFFKGILFPLCEVRLFPLPSRLDADLSVVERNLHSSRSCDYRKCSHESQRSGAAFRSSAAEAVGDGLHWFVERILCSKHADDYAAGPNSLFIRVLLDKKYALPYKVVDALVFHFISFKRDPRVMPVLWHQSFLVFVQRFVSLHLRSLASPLILTA